MSFMVKPRIVILLLLLVNSGHKPSVRASFAGPYWLKIRQIGSCPKEEVSGVEVDDVAISVVTRYNHTIKGQVLDANATIANKIYYPRHTTMKLDIAKWDTVSGWRDHFLVMALGEMCFVYDEIVADIMAAMARSNGIPLKCPITDGLYAVLNVPTQMKPLRRFPSLPYGRYRVYVMFGFMNKAISGLRGCLKTVADVVPNLPVRN